MPQQKRLSELCISTEKPVGGLASFQETGECIFLSLILLLHTENSFSFSQTLILVLFSNQYCFQNQFLLPLTVQTNAVAPAAPSMCWSPEKQMRQGSEMWRPKLNLWPQTLQQQQLQALLSTTVPPRAIPTPPEEQVCAPYPFACSSSHRRMTLGRLPNGAEHDFNQCTFLSVCQSCNSRSTC